MGKYKEQVFAPLSRVVAPEIAAANRDLWWEAREYTRRLAEQEAIEAAKAGKKSLGQQLIESLFKKVMTSYPGQPVVEVMSATAIATRPDVVWFPDLNKYRIRDLQVYIDLGCKAFCFRMGGPLQWVEGNPKWTLDPTYRPYIEAAERLGVIDQTIGYIVHSPFEVWTPNGATGETIHTELIDEWTSGGYMPAAFMYDHEIDMHWRGATEVYATPYNLVKSLQENTHNTYTKFRRTVSIYTAAWFAHKRPGYWEQHDTYFYNVNKPESMGGVGTQRPLWLAWYGQQMTKEYSNVAQIGTDLFTPTPENVGKYLWIGHQANAWQFSSTLKTPGDSIGVDMNISLDPSKLFYYNFGLKEPGGTIPDPDPQDPPTGDLAELIERMGLYEQAHAALKARVDAAGNALKP